MFVGRLFPNYIVITQFVSIRDYYGLTTFETFIIDKRIRPYPFTKLQKFEIQMFHFYEFRIQSKFLFGFNLGQMFRSDFPSGVQVSKERVKFRTS